MTHWQDLATNYDQVMKEVPVMQSLYQKISAGITKQPESILDLGCGTGELLSMIHQNHPTAKLVALDPATNMLEYTRKKFEDASLLSLVEGSADDLPLESDQFDYVISNYALHHLDHKQKQICAREVFRVLKPGGTLLYGDQHCRMMGGPHDKEWVREMLDLLYTKASHYLDTASFDRMLLQVELMPKFLKADGEIPATVEYWKSCLDNAGFVNTNVIDIEPAELLNRVMIAEKPE